MRSRPLDRTPIKVAFPCFKSVGGLVTGNGILPLVEARNIGEQLSRGISASGRSTEPVRSPMTNLRKTLLQLLDKQGHEPQCYTVQSVIGGLASAYELSPAGYHADDFEARKASWLPDGKTDIMTDTLLGVTWEGATGYQGEERLLVSFTGGGRRFAACATTGWSRKIR